MSVKVPSAQHPSLLVLLICISNDSESYLFGLYAFERSCGLLDDDNGALASSATRREFLLNPSSGGNVLVSRVVPMSKEFSW